MSSATDTGTASAVPYTPEQAERLLAAAKTAREARQIYLFCAEQEEDWQAIKLIAFRRCGELLGPVEEQGHTGRGHSVSATHAMSDGDRDFRRRARQVAAVPQEQFDEYLATATNPTRAELLRKYGPGKKKQKQQKPAAAKKSKPTPAGKRMHAAKLARAEAKRNGRPLAFWEIGWEVSRLVYGLAAWNVEEAELDYDSINTMQTVEEDLLYLYDWMDDTLSLIHSRMGEHGMRQQLGKLRAKTVANGCTPEEADAAQRAAKRLQRKIDNALEAVG